MTLRWGLATLAATWLGVAWMVPGLATLDRTYFRDDTGKLFYPRHVFAARSLGEGRLFRWDPYTYAGTPLLAEAHQGALHPVHWILSLAIPPERSFPACYVAQYLVAALGAFLFVRAMGCSPPICATAGWLYALNGTQLVYAPDLSQFAAQAAIPWVFLGMRSLARSPGPRSAAACAAAWALQFLSNYPQVQAYTVLVAVPYAVWEARRVGSVARAAAWGGAGAALAAGVCAVQLLPALALVPHGPRAGGLSYEAATADSLHPVHLANLVLPYLFGSWRDGLERYWGMFNWCTVNLYAGLVPLALAVAAVLRPPRDEARFFRWAALFSLWGALGNFGGFYRLVHALPGFDLFRMPPRGLALFQFSLCVLAACEAERILCGRTAWRSSRRARLAAAGAGLALLAGIGACAASGAARGVPPRGDVERLVRAGEAGPGDVARWGLARLVGEPRNAVLGAGLLLPSILAFLSRRAGVRAAAMAAGLFAAADLGLYGRDLWPTAPRALLEEEPDSVRWLRARPDPWFRISPIGAHVPTQRVFRYGWAGGARTDGYFELQSDCLPCAYGLFSAQGHGYPSAGMSRLTAAPAPGTVRAWPEAGVLSLLGVRYALLDVEDRERAAPEGWREAYANRYVRIFENAAPLPMAFAIGRTREVPAAEALALVEAGRFDPWTEALLDPVEAGVPQDGAGARPAEIVSWGEEEVRVRVPPGSGTMLVLNQQFLPGWEASAGGRTLPVVRADAVLSAVVLPEGAARDGCEVVFRYVPREGPLGIAVSAVCVVLLGLLAVGRRRPSVGVAA